MLIVPAVTNRTMKAQLGISVVDDSEILRVGKSALNIRINQRWSQPQGLLGIRVNQCWTEIRGGLLLTL